MSCYSEFTYSVYADGELPAEEKLRVEAHLATCRPCRAVVEALRAETLMLVDVLADARAELETLPELHPASPSRLILGALAALAGVILGLRAAVLGLIDSSFSQMALGDTISHVLSWLNPSSWTAQITFLFSGFFYLMDEGASMLFWGITVIGSLILVLLLVSGSVLLAKRRPAGFNSLALLALLLGLAFAPRASATEVHHTEGSYTLPSGKTLNDTLIFGGDAATIDGDINGNLIFGGRRLIVRGNIKGDVICGGQSMDIDGTVSGNVFCGSQSLTISGKVGGSVHSWSQEFRLKDKAVIGGDLLGFGAAVEVDGEVTRDVMLFAGGASITGKVGRNLEMRGDVLSVSSSAKIGGDLDARLGHPERAEIAGTIAGSKSIEKNVDRDWDNTTRYSHGRFYFWQFIQLLAALLTGTLLLILFPSFYRGTAQALGYTWMPLLRSLGLGFAVLIALPVAATMLCFTLIGIPISILGLMLWIVGLYFAKIFIGAVVGDIVLQRPSAGRQEALLALLGGLAIYFVAVNLPYAVGGVLHFLTLCIGLGALSYRLGTSFQTTA